MSRNRWLFSIFGLVLLPVMIVLGSAMRPSAAASPLLQDETATATLTATDEITSTATLTATTIVTETATAVETETATPIETETATPTETAIPTDTVTPGPIARPFWSFAAKFVCGEQPADLDGQPIQGEPAVKPGDYATEINIHNPHYLGPIHIRAKVLLLVDRGAPVGRAPGVAEPGSFSPLFALPDDGATMEDCNSIWERLNPGTPPPTPMPLMIGYLVVVSPANLDVVGVMSATTATSNLEPAGISLETVSVEGKRVLVPSTAFPDSVLPRDQEFTEE